MVYRFVIAIGFVVGCSGQDGSSDDALGKSFTNPVLKASEGCADPGVLLEGSTYIMACTGDFGLWRSTDLVHWTHDGHLGTPGWADKDFWAPEVHSIGGKHVAYYAARQSKNGELAVGVAWEKAPNDWQHSKHPLVTDSIGAIDPTEITTGGKNYLFWKEDGNSRGWKTIIYAQELTADGHGIAGSRHEVLRNDEPWEGDVVEAPWVLERGSYFYLFYTGNDYATHRYAIGVARSHHILGPYTKLESGPVVHSDIHHPGWGGPGHNSIVTAPHGATYLVYAAHHMDGAGNLNGPRSILVDKIDDWNNEWPHVSHDAPTISPQAMP